MVMNVVRILAGLLLAAGLTAASSELAFAQVTCTTKDGRVLRGYEITADSTTITLEADTDVPVIRRSDIASVDAVGLPEIRVPYYENRTLVYADLHDGTELSGILVGIDGAVLDVLTDDGTVVMVDTSTATEIRLRRYEEFDHERYPTVGLYVTQTGQPEIAVGYYVRDIGTRLGAWYADRENCHVEAAVIYDVIANRFGSTNLLFAVGYSSARLTAGVGSTTQVYVNRYAAVGFQGDAIGVTLGAGFGITSSSDRGVHVTPIVRIGYTYRFD